MKGDITRKTFDPGKHYTGVLSQQGRVQTDADYNEQVDIANHLRHTGHRDIIGASGAPADNPGFALRNEDGNLIIGRGHYYLDGILCVNEAEHAFTEQPDLPGQDFPPNEGHGFYLAYLDVWQRHITALKDPGIREVALGGPDTTTRTQTVCQVKLFRLQEQAHCLSALPDWEQFIAPSDGRLSARTDPSQEADGSCLVPPDAGFSGLENQLYRVEVHQSGGPDEATFKWDRDNGSIAFSIEDFLDDQPTDRIRLSSVGKYDIRSLNPDEDLLEITDDIRELNGEPGELHRIASIDPVTGIITLEEPVDGLSQDHRPRVRRWKGEETNISADGNIFHSLENGVEVRIEGDRFRTGDYWLIPARTATRNVEWPTQINGNGDPEPLLRPPLGIEHGYARLALLEFVGGDFSVFEDCRIIFLPLAQKALKVVNVETEIDGQPFPNNGVVLPDTLIRGLRIGFSAPLTPDVIDLGTQGIPGTEVHPALFVRVHLPYPLIPDDRQFWDVDDNQIFGFQPIKLAAEISFSNDRQDVVRWLPVGATTSWIQELFPRLALAGLGQAIVDRILCELWLDGNFIWADGPDGDRVFLDGDTTADPTRSMRLGLPSGNSTRGGIFRMWFWLVPELPQPLELSVSVNLNVVSGVVSSAGTRVVATVRLLRNTPPGVGTEQTTESDAEGQFSFTALEGDYTVIAVAFGTTAEQDVEVGPVIVSPGGGGGGGGPSGPGDLSVIEINGIGPRRADELAVHGVTTIREFLLLNTSRIAEILTGVSEDGARELIANARRRLLVG
jgi:hypothetical protein